ncbi:hypothetical protein OG21DRAFT_1507825 [Imleria badia]|nr:hypothetical protein OG21DRAFT_1507825 [Imleria badia]
MHHVLQIQEIVLNIFGHCRLPTWESSASDLPTLARTCRAFKEPALDVLWEELLDPSPLAICLPGAYRYSQVDQRTPKYYSFSRSLTEIEWRILRSYTHRIRSMLDAWDRLDWESVGTFLNPPTTEPLLPNLRDLYAVASTESKIKHLLSMPFPSLISLGVSYTGPNASSVFHGPLESFFKFSPSIKRLYVSLMFDTIAFGKFFSSYICRWQDLNSLSCTSIPLDVGTFEHLSRMPALTRLSCSLSAFPPSDSPLLFTNLYRLELFYEFLDSISQLLSRTRLPAITQFAVYVDSCPSKQGFSSFLASVQTSVVVHTIQELTFGGEFLRMRDEERLLGFEDLQPCMAFSTLRRIDLNLTWEVDLTDNELLTLASAWPHLEHLLINREWGWNTLGGITPNGLLELLRTCPSLSDIALAIDTRGYTEFRESPESLGFMLPPTFCFNVLDSFIEEESVPAIAAFFTAIAPCVNWTFQVGRSALAAGISDYEEGWYDVYDRLRDALGQQS